MVYYEKVGYLNATHKLFYINNVPDKDIAAHYHDFHKILLFVKGDVNYYIEGHNYQLSGGDIVLVPAGSIHKPIFNSKTNYERIIIYLSNDFFKDTAAPLLSCFQSHTNIIRTSTRKSPFLQVNALRHSFAEKDSVSDIYQNALLLELLVYIHRFLSAEQSVAEDISSSNPTILTILSYINEHLSDALSIDAIADALYLNRSYIMHLFKEETGDTLNHYIINKRLYQAQMLMTNDTSLSLTDISYACGFASYSTFYRAYRNKYGHSPKAGA